MTSIINAMVSREGQPVPPGEDKSLSRIIDLFSKYDAIDASLAIATTLVREAIAELSVFPEGILKDRLLTMAEFAIQRDK